MSLVWIIDDEPAICWALRKNLEADLHKVQVFAAAEPALKQLSTNLAKPDLVLMDVRLPGIDGIDALQQMAHKSPNLPVIVMTAFGDLQTAVKAVHAEAFEYVTKPFDLEAMLQSVKRALNQGNVEENRVETTEPNRVSSNLLIGSSAVMQAVYKRIAVAAKSDIPILIEGERGTGKELVAAMIHRFSSRSNQPFLPTTPTASPLSDFDAELFGVISNEQAPPTILRSGVLALAGHGTVLIDEVGDVPLAVQAKLHRTIESRQFVRIGDNASQDLQSRLLFSTNRDLEQLLKDGEMREDLYSLLSVYKITLPPLRQRRDDIDALAIAFLAKHAQSKRLTISEEAMCELRNRDWPGNVRELKLAIDHAVLVATGAVIHLEDLPPIAINKSLSTLNVSQQQRLEEGIKQWAQTQLESVSHSSEQPPSEEYLGTLFDDLMAVVEPPLIRSVLDHFKGNRAAAAIQLGLHRSTLRQKMRRYDMEK